MIASDWTATITARRLRLASGAVLFVYLATHLINHAVGLISLAAAEAVLSVAKAVWYSLPGTVILYGAAATHVALALRTVYLRQHWRLPLVELIRLGSGFSLPLLLIGHAVTTRLAVATQGADPHYASVVQALLSSGTEGWQLALLAPGWVHGGLGLWLTIARRWPRRAIRWGFFLFMALLPLLAAAGFLSMRAEVAAQAAATIAGAAGAGASAALDGWRRALSYTYLLAVIGALVAGLAKRGIMRSVSRSG
jgi:adenylate cyclase